MPWAVAGSEDDVDLETGELEMLSAGHGLLGVPALVRPETLPRDVGHDVREDARLELRAVDGSARCLRDRRDCADVVEVRMG